MIKVAINGYGTIGKRVADAVAAQKDMKVIGVSKTRPNAEAFIAKQRGYPLYIADVSKKAAFERVGLAVAGSVEDMCKAADVIVDATPGGVGASNKAIYEKLGKKALWQGGEDQRWPGSPLIRPAISKMPSAGSLSGSSPATPPASPDHPRDRQGIRCRARPRDHGAQGIRPRRDQEGPIDAVVLTR